MKLFLTAFIVVGCLFAKAIADGDSSKNEMNENRPAQTLDALPKLKNPRLVVKKSKRSLELFDGETLIKTYSIALGFSPEGNKEKQGDGKTPEGNFYVFTKNEKSKFYLSLGLSYPNIEDAARGLKEKIITQNQYDRIVKAVKEKKSPPQNTALGGDIYIHGGGIQSDWTWGCVALERGNIKELFDIIPVGATVRIEP